MLVASWDSGLSTQEALKGLRWKLHKWNKEVYRDIQIRKEKLVAEIKELHDLLEVAQTDVLLTKEEELIKNFDSVQEQEETLWFQKSREKFLSLGDRNTTFSYINCYLKEKKSNRDVEGFKG